MKTFDSAAELAEVVGEELGVSDYIEVDQDAIDAFARATGDHQWIHVDVARAKREMPDGKTIGHGYLTLALISVLAQQLYAVRTNRPVLNYGLNRVRFTGVVQVGSRLRLRLKVASVEQTAAGTRITMQNIIEAQGIEKPVLVAENLVLYSW